MLQTKASVSDQYNLQVCGAYLNDSIEAIRHLFHHQQENQSKTFTKTLTITIKEFCGFQAKMPQNTDLIFA